jgi:hypothetical protein
VSYAHHVRALAEARRRAHERFCAENLRPPTSEELSELWGVQDASKARAHVHRILGLALEITPSPRKASPPGKVRNAILTWLGGLTGAFPTLPEVMQKFRISKSTAFFHMKTLFDDHPELFPWKVAGVTRQGEDLVWESNGVTYRARRID